MADKKLSGEEYLKSALNAFPSPVLIVDRDLWIQDANRAALELAGSGPGEIHQQLCGGFIHCIHAIESEGGCGTTEFCPHCVLRQTAEAVTDGKRTFRRMSEMELVREGQTRKVWFLVTGAPFEYKNRKLAVLTLEDVTELIELRRIIPVCSHCHKVRDDADYWQNVEDYLKKYTGIKFSHGICPDCLRKYYPELADEVIGQRNSSDKGKPRR